jgi:integrase
MYGRLRFHDMRHSFVTLMAERNIPLQVVGSMVGHMSETMTRHYTSISSRVMREAVEKLDRQPDHVGSPVGPQEIGLGKPSNLLN